MTTSTSAAPTVEGRPSTARSAALGFAAVVVGLQIAYPLLSGRALTLLTVATVVVFAAASVSSAAAQLGARAAAVLAVVAAGGGLLAEVVGVRTGVPFGAYAYGRSLGPRVAGVPLLVPAAWLMMAWPALLVGRRLAAALRLPRRAAALPAAWTLAAWDVLLDPQMVSAGHWRWAHPAPALPGTSGVPLTNAAGWLVVGLLLELLLDAALPRPAAPDREREWASPALLAWTWLGSSLASAAFFHRPAVAAWGFLALGVVVGPYLVLLGRDGGAGRPRVPGAGRALR